MNNSTAACKSGGRRGFWVIAGVIMCAEISIAAIEVAASPLCVSERMAGSLSARQGEVVMVKVPEADREAAMSGTFMGRAVPFFVDTRPQRPGGYAGLLGIDVQDPPGAQRLTIIVKGNGRERCLQVFVTVIKGDFPVQRLTLPREKVDLDEKSVVRWKEEQRAVTFALARDFPKLLWERPFGEPVQGPRTGAFGSVRIMNGQPRAPHNGIDIAAPLGTDVAASSDGVVRLAVDHLLSGKGVYLDHGFGLYTMYFHLSEVLVRDGDSVKAGQIIGRVGATGRASGPHLHWGARLNGARVDPESLLAVPYRRKAAPTEAQHDAIPSGRGN